MALSAEAKEQRARARKLLLEIAENRQIASVDERVKAAAVVLQDLVNEQAMA